MEERKRRFWRTHLDLLILAAGFALYAWLTSIFLPNGFFHCLLHDVCRLYCPFCGGTRAFLALLRFDFGEALRLNPAAIAAGVAAVVLDARALVRVLRNDPRPLLPRDTWQAAVVYFAGFTAVRNVLLFYGVDPAGDLAAFWEPRLTPLFAAIASVSVACLAAGVTWLTFARTARTRCLLACGCLAFATVLAVTLTKINLLFTILILPTTILLVFFRHKRNKNPKQI